MQAEKPARSATAAKATQPEAADVLLLAECDFAYLGQPYVVAPDGRVLPAGR